MRRLVAVAVVVVSLAGCGRATKTSEDKLLDAIDATELLSRTMTYDVRGSSGALGVDITVEDDYRYAAELLLDDDVAYREVVFDDALAAQLVLADATSLLGQPPKPATVLTAGSWLVDDLGAPSTLLGVGRRGADPIVDALGFLAYVREAARASEVRKFDRSALDYRPDEDPFDQPEKGEIRYDILPTELPSRSSVERGGTADVPETSDFRKLAVYVRDGVIVSVRESIDLKTFVGDLRRSFAMRGASESALLQKINELRTLIGQDPIEERTTTLTIERRDDLRVDLPTGTSAKLSLHLGDAAAAG